jgi:hypothetical protein
MYQQSMKTKTTHTIEHAEIFLSFQVVLLCLRQIQIKPFKN